jgi:hypothetical protein
MRKLPVLNLTPLNFPSQNQRYIVERDTANRLATSLGLINFSINIGPPPRIFFLISISKRVPISFAWTKKQQFLSPQINRKNFIIIF